MKFFTISPIRCFAFSTIECALCTRRISKSIGWCSEHDFKRSQQVENAIYMNQVNKKSINNWQKVGNSILNSFAIQSLAWLQSHSDFLLLSLVGILQFHSLGIDEKWIFYWICRDECENPKQTIHWSYFYWLRVRVPNGKLNSAQCIKCKQFIC